MANVKTITKLVGTERSIATQDIESLRRRFEIMQDERLQSPAKIPTKVNDPSACSTAHRLFVRIYYAPSQRDQLTL